MNRTVTELADKRRIVEMLATVREWPEPGSVVFSKPPREAELISHTHGAVRLLLTLNGEYRFRYYNDGLRNATTSAGDILYVDKKGVLINVLNSECLVLTVIFWDNFTRFLISERKHERYRNYWYHTAKPVCNAGRHLVRCISEINLNDLAIPAIRELLKSLIEVSFYEINNDSTVSAGKAHGTYQIIRDYLQQNMHRTITRESVAGSVGVTPSHVSKLFQRFDDHSFNDALQRLRINRAAQLLEDYAVNISEVAGLCGFKDATHFIKVFRKFHDITPARYRDNHQK